MGNIERVQAFVAAWNRTDFETVYGMMSPDIFYHNIPWAPRNGLDEVKASVGAFGIETCDWTIHHIAENGPVVLTERTDRIKANGHWVTVRVMGAFEFENGKIKAWRDYFDTGDLTPKAE